MQLRSLLGFVFPFLLACGSVEVTPGGSSNDVPPTVRASCQDLFSKQQAYGQRCLGAFADVLDEEAYVASCVGIAAAPGVTLTATDIAACAAEVDAADCSGGSVVPTCVGYGRDLLYPEHDKKGTLTPGEPCFANVQCDSGYCDSGWDTCGACQRTRTLGEGCSGENDVCIEGSCQAGTCELPGKKLGEDCIDYGGGDCQPTLYCKGVAPDTVMGICVPRGQEGDACDDDAVCIEPLQCHGGACVKLSPDGAACTEDSLCASFHCQGGVCAERPTGLAVGDDCSVGYCRADLICDDDYVCRALSYVAEGGVCSPGGALDKRCALDLYCHYTCTNGDCSPGDCRPLPKAGGPCSTMGTCVEGAVCQGFNVGEGTPGLCMQLGGLGEACPCVETLACVGGVCAAFGAAVCE